MQPGALAPTLAPPSGEETLPTPDTVRDVPSGGTCAARMAMPVMALIFAWRLVV